MQRLVLSVSVLSLILGACESDRDEPDAGADDATIGELDAGPITDGNDSFATATTLGAEPSPGTINPAGDLDYFRFTGTAGQWVILATAANADDEDARLDTVITLYDAAMNVIAEADDSVPRVSTDSELITRLPADGTYYALVQEFSTWADEEARGQPDFTYELTLLTFSPSADAVNIDEEAGDAVGDAQTLGFDALTNADFAFVVGTFRDESDVDVFAFGGSDTRRLVSATLMPDGPDANGATILPSRVWVTNADGTDTIAEIDPAAFVAADELVELSPSLGPGDYRLWIEHGGARGANDFYVLKLYRFEDNPLETMEASNDIAPTAEPIALEDREGSQRGFVLATLADDDTDHFTIEVGAAQLVSVSCGSRSNGSGVLDLAVTLLDAAGATELASATETATANAFIDAHAIDTAGSYVVRLSRGAQASGVSGAWVRCGVTVAPPSTP